MVLGQLKNIHPISHNVTMRYDEMQNRRGKNSSQVATRKNLVELKGP